MDLKRRAKVFWTKLTSSLLPSLSLFSFSCVFALSREDGLDRVAALKARLAAVKKAREEAKSSKGKGKGKAATTEVVEEA